MRFALLAVVPTVAVLAGVPTVANADSYWDVEAARANARAGGPTNAYDAELLERYGCLSGTRSSLCQGLAHGERPSYRKPRRSSRR